MSRKRAPTTDSNGWCTSSCSGHSYGTCPYQTKDQLEKICFKHNSDSNQQSIWVIVEVWHDGQRKIRDSAFDISSRAGGANWLCWHPTAQQKQIVMTGKQGLGANSAPLNKNGKLRLIMTSDAKPDAPARITKISVTVNREYQRSDCTTGIQSYTRTFDRFSRPGNGQTTKCEFGNFDTCCSCYDCNDCDARLWRYFKLDQTKCREWDFEIGTYTCSLTSGDYSLESQCKHRRCS